MNSLRRSMAFPDSEDQPRCNSIKQIQLQPFLFPHASSKSPDCRNFSYQSIFIHYKRMNPQKYLRKINDKFTNSALVKTLKRLLFQQSHLSPYLPIMKQELSSKILRLHEDESYKTVQMIQDGHARMHAKGDNQFLYNLIFTEKKCYDPILGWLLVWYAFVFVAIIYSYVEMGLILTYWEDAWVDLHSNPFTIALNVYCIVVFSVDMYVQFNTGYIFRGVIITDKSRVVSNYLRSVFLPDLLLIVIMVTALLSSDIYINIVRVIVVTKFIRMLDIDELYVRKISTRKTLKVYYVISKQFITIFILSHTVGLFFYAIDYALTNDLVCLQNNSLCWLYSATAYSPILNYGWRIQYFYTLYWGVNTITTISYGDIAPNNPMETIYALFCFCFGFIVYGYVVNNIVKVILWARTINNNFKHDLILYTTYMDNLKIGTALQYEIRDYLEHQYIEENARNMVIEEQMKARLPEGLKDQLLRNAYLQLQNHLEYIFLRSPSITKLLYFLKEKKFTENEVILRQGANVSELYYLYQGQVSLACIYGQRLHQITIIDTPDSFLSPFEYFLGEKANYTITIARTSTLYFISKEHMDQQIQAFTDLRENFKLLEYELRISLNFNRIFYHCFYCRKNHHWYQCTNCFPSFSQATLDKFRDDRNRKRFPRPFLHCWRNRSNLSQLFKITQQPAFMLLQKMKERIYELRKMKQSMRSSFDVDVGYDWVYYLPGFNFSVFKKEWNERRTRKLTKDMKLQSLINIGLT